MTLGWRGSRQGINRGEDLWGKDRVKSERSEGGPNVKQNTAAFFSLLDYESLSSLFINLAGEWDFIFTNRTCVLL